MEVYEIKLENISTGEEQHPLSFPVVAGSDHSVAKATQQTGHSFME